MTSRIDQTCSSQLLTMMNKPWIYGYNCMHDCWKQTLTCLITTDGIIQNVAEMHLNSPTSDCAMDI
ncbi:hypothetical protein MAR_001270 [Mya arenaria]|uniref:Uncharacterized protein n=1 Tax=Mya arenaria TaxID=6604 RepID=A0ABY7FB81_MYAAR|nr:hypothetical protein MAR_001270 [Mya arenaria]